MGFSGCSLVLVATALEDTGTNDIMDIRITDAMPFAGVLNVN